MKFRGDRRETIHFLVSDLFFRPIVFWMSISWRQRIYWYMDILGCMDMFLITKILDLAYVQKYMHCLSQNKSDTKLIRDICSLSSPLTNIQIYSNYYIDNSYERSIWLTPRIFKCMFILWDCLLFLIYKNPLSLTIPIKQTFPKLWSKTELVGFVHFVC